MTLNEKIADSKKRHNQITQIRESKVLEFIQSLIQDGILKKENAQQLNDFLAFGAKDVMLVAALDSDRSKFSTTLNGQLQVKMDNDSMTFYVDSAYSVSVGYLEVVKVFVEERVIKFVTDSDIQDFEGLKLPFHYMP